MPAGDLTGYADARPRDAARERGDRQSARRRDRAWCSPFHAMSAYIAFIPQHPFAFDAPPFLWRAFPIVDQQRWFGFDLFCAWLDVFLMSFFFCCRGCSSGRACRARGRRAFLQDRLLRLGLPFAAVVMLLMPLALYPTYLQSSGDHERSPDTGGTWLALPFWPSGPIWFLWLLVLWDVLAAGVYLLLRRHGDARAAPLVLCAAAPGGLSRRVAARVGAGLCPAGAALRAGELVPGRPVRVPAQPPAALRALFLRRRRRSAPAASSAACSRRTARWRGAGRVAGRGCRCCSSPGAG